jgi:hypothetical protein
MRDPWRAFRRALTVLGGAGCAAVAACNAILGNGTAPYVPPDSEVLESGGTDASGNSFDGWCTAHQLLPLCADFDEPGWALNDAGQLFPPSGLYPKGIEFEPALAGEAEMSASDAAVSPPFSFQTSRTTPVSGANISFFPFLGSDSPTLPARVTLSFDLSVVSGCWMAFIGNVSITQSARLTFGLALTGLQMRPYVQSGGTETKRARTFIALSSLPLPDAGFARVTLTIDFVNSVLDMSMTPEDASADASLQSAVDWTSATSWTGGGQGQSPPAFEAGAPVSLGATSVQFGTSPGGVGPGFGGELSDAGPCVLRIDNAWATSETVGDQE